MKRIYIASLLIIISLSNGFSQLTFTVSPNMTDLTNYFQGIGLTISNMTVTGSPNSYGFYSGTSNMAFGSGIIMSSGSVDSTINNPATVFLNTNNSTAGDMMLDNVSGSPTFDACIIEFDCVPTNANLLFDFAFGSEEYNDFVNLSVNDVFAIFVSGANPSGGSYLNTNFALIPSTNIPVSINTINNGNSISASAGPCTNCAYFIDNDGGTSVAYDGFTTGLQGLVPVIPGQTYHFKIAIADAGDNIFDSSVMFLTNSFKSVSTVTSISENQNKNDLIIYPIPAKDKIYYNSSTFKVTKVELFSIDGKKENVKLDSQDFSIDTRGLDAGIYSLHLFNENNKIVKKVIIQ
jgi:hypothetical protein